MSRLPFNNDILLNTENILLIILENEGDECKELDYKVKLLLKSKFEPDHFTNKGMEMIRKIKNDHRSTNLHESVVHVGKWVQT